jgi:diguanylate cyclase (GGDEF)-like protein
MGSVSVRRVVGALGAMVALLTALSLYAAISYWKGGQALSLRAERSAARAARFITASGPEWASRQALLANALDLYNTDSDPIRERIIDTHGTVLLERGKILAAPTHARTAPIAVDGVVLGRIEVAASLRPLINEVGIIGLGSLTLGMMAYLVFAVWPLRVLDRSFGDLEGANARFRSQNLLLDAALANMFQGLAMFDPDERLVIANDRFAEIYGLGPDQVRPGTSLRTILEHRLARGLHEGETVDSLLVELRQHLSRQRAGHLAERLSDGRTILVSIRPRAEGGWVTTHQDVTERENLNAELALQNERLMQREIQLEQQNGLLDAAVQSTHRSWAIVDAALNNMSQGLAMFDTDRRLVVCNKVYYQLYGLTADQVKPGMTSREIVALRVAKGVYGEVDADRFIDDWFADDPTLTTRVQPLTDGRLISVCRHRLRDGRLVVTHEDITERERLNSELAREHDLTQRLLTELERQKQQLDAALNNMSQGLAMFDGDQRVVICNSLFAQMHGLTEEQVKPGESLQSITERLVASGLYSEKSASDLLSWMQRSATESAAPRHIVELADGRFLAVSARQMPAGGIVTTYQDVTEQRRAEARIVHMALHDTLTELPNRMLLNERLEHALTRVRRGEVVAVHMLDLDHFKAVNDTLGHPAGDKLLKVVTDRLRALVRETDTVARIGGDEFAVVQVAIAHPEDATTLARRIVEVVSRPYDIDGHQVVIGTTVGIAMGPADGNTPDALIRNADLALCRAKGETRNTFCFFEPEMDAQMQAQRAMEYDMRRGLTAGEFELHYQPIINLATDQITGFEALIRWHHPKNGTVAPCKFIPVAEKIDSIVSLGDWVIRDSCATAAKWPNGLKVAINISPAQFRSPRLSQVIGGALRASGLSPDRLEIEVTELVLSGDREMTHNVLARLRELGVRIAMDDFGTGFSSLSQLQNFHFDKIKIDRSFVRDVASGDAGSLNMVRAVTAMAKGMGVSTTAEGVETREQLEIVRAEGCTEVQGFLISPPVPAQEVEALLRSNGNPHNADSNADAA